VGRRLAARGLTLAAANTTGNYTIDTVKFTSGIGTFNIGAMAGGASNSQILLADSAGQAVTLSVGAKNVNTSYAGGFRGNGNLIKVGTGTQTLTNNSNGWTGNITINGGTLVAGSNGTLGSISYPGRTITANSGTTLSFTTNNIFGNGQGQTSIPVITPNSATLTSTRYNILGNITLNGATLTGSITDNAGTPLTDASFHGFAFRGNVTVGGSAPSLISTGNVNANHLGPNTTFNVADVTGNANVDLTVSTALLNQSNDYLLSAYTLNPTASDRTASLTKTGAGTMLMTGANQYTGNTTVLQGTLTVTGRPASTDTGTWTTTNGVVTGLTSTAGLVVGQPVSGNGIAAGVVIRSIDSATQVTLTATPTVANTASTINFGSTTPLGTGATSTVSVANGATLDATGVTGGLSLVAGQALANNGTVAGPVNISTSNTMSGGGTFSGGLALGAGGTIAPGGTTGSTATMTTSSLSTSAGNLALGIGGANSDKIVVTNGATIAGGTTITLQLLSPTSQAFYDVLTAGTLAGTPTLSTTAIGRTHFALDGAPPANTIRIDVTGTAANVSWTGTVSGIWDNLQTGANWNTTDAGVVDTTHFYDGDVVTFDDNNGGHYAVNVNSTVTPSSGVTVNNSSGDYAISGSGSIAGPGSLLKNGSSALSLATLNSYSGGTALNAGTLNINSPNAIGTGPLTIAAGTSIGNTGGAAITLLTNNAQVWNGSFTFNGTADGNSNLSMGSGAVTLNSNPTITVTAGRLTIGGPIRNGTGNSLTVSGNGALFLGGPNTYTGGTTTINAGATVIVGNTVTPFGSNTGGAVTVNAGGMIDLSGITNANIAGGFMQKQFFIAGNGVNNLGALTNSGVNQQNYFERVTLTADASVGGGVRFDIRNFNGLSSQNNNGAVLDLAGHTFTNNNTSFLGIVGVEITDGNIVTKFGNFDFETTTNLRDFGTGTKFTIDTNATASTFDFRGTLTRPIVMNDGARLLTNGGGLDLPTIGSNITLNGNVSFGALNGNGGGTMTLNGTISETGGSRGITKIFNGTGNSALILAGNNTFTGGVTINGGVVQVSNPGALNSTTPNTVTLNASGTSGQPAPRLRLNGNSITVNGLNSTGVNAFNTAIVENNHATLPATLTVNVATNPNFDGILQNGGAATLSLVTTGSGTLILSNDSTYTGSTTLNGGTLQIGANTATGSISGTSGVSGVGGTLLDFNRTADLTFAVPVTGSVGLTQDGTNTLKLTGANTYSGATNINAGTLLVASGLNSGGAVNVNANGTLAANSSIGNVTTASGSSVRPGAAATDGSAGTIAMNTLTASGGDFRMDIGGDLINVTGLAHYTGPTTITPTAAVTAGTYTLLNAGTLTIDNGDTPTVNQISGARVTFNVLTQTGPSGFIKLNVVGNPGALLWKGNVDAGGGVFVWDVQTTKNWTNTVTSQPDFFFTADNVTFDNTGVNKTVTINDPNGVAPSTITVNNSTGNDYTFTGSSANGVTGAANLTKMGTGALILNNTNTYSGATNIQNGTLVLGNNASLPANTSVVLGAGSTSGILDLNGKSPTLVSLATAGTGTANLIGNSSTSTGSTLTVAGGTNTFGGIIQDTLGAGNQTVSLAVPSGTLILTGNNTYTGFTSVSDPSATLQIGNGGTSGNLSATTSIDVEGAMVFNRSDTFTFPASIGGGGSVRQAGSGTVIFTGDHGYTGGTTISSGSLQLGNGGTTGSLLGPVVDNGTLIFNRSDDINFNNIISGTGGITKNGPNTVAIPSTTVNPAGYTGNTFTGNVVVNSGTLVASYGNANAGNNQGLNGSLGRFDALGGSAGRTITVNAGATMRWIVNNVFGNQNDTTAVNVVTLDGSLLPAITLNGSLLVSTRYNQLGNITLNGAQLDQSATDGPGSYEGYQFLGTVTVGGTAPSTITTGNGKANHLAINTTFNVADATGDANADLVISAPLRSASGDYGLVAGGFTKLGAGTMELDSTTSNFTGGVTGGGGTVLVTANSPAGGPGPLGSGAAAILLGLGSGSASDAILGKGGITIGRNVTLQAGDTGTNTLGTSDDAAGTFSGNIVLNNALTIQAGTTAAASVSFAPTGTGTGDVVAAGPGTVNFNSTTAVSLGSLTVSPGVTLNASGVTRLNAAGTITVGAGANLNLQAGGTVSSAAGRLTHVANNLALGGSGATIGNLELNNHELLLNNANPATIKGYLASAYDPNGNADWGQRGLTSSLAKGNPTVYSVGYAYGGDQSAQDAGITTHGGAPLGATQTIVRPVLAGDANLDGKVDFFDISQVLGYRYNAGGNNAAYTDGDLDYNGQVDFFDISVILSANYNTGQSFGPGGAAAAVPSLSGSHHAASTGAAIASATTIGTSGDGKPDFLYNRATGDLQFFIDGKSVPTFISSLAVQSASGILLPAGASAAMVNSVGATLTTSTIAGSLTNSPGFTNGFDLGNILPANLTDSQIMTDLTVRYQVLNSGGLVAGDVTVPEPTGLALLGLAAAGLLARARRHPR
jgi:autotransporter-associated beta strand protein